MSINITLGNAKGGVGKTLVTNYLAYHLAEMNKKVLVIDCDPQGNTTDLYLKKLGEDIQIKTLYQGLKSKNLKETINQISNNLFFIGTGTDLVKLEDMLRGQKDKITFLSKHLEDIEQKFDFIFFDVPPSPYSTFVNNALGASDYFLIITELSSDSFKGIPTFYEVASSINDNFNERLDFLGVIINRRENDKETFSKISEVHNLESEEFFKNYIPKRSRFFKYMEDGIYNYTSKKNFINEFDRWDLELYTVGENITKELLERIDRS